MTIKELKEELDNYNEDLEIRIAEQPHYPMEYSIQGLRDFNKENKEIVYLLEGEQKGYLSKEVFD